MDYISFCKKFFSVTNIPVSLLKDGAVAYSALGELLSVTPPMQWQLFDPGRNPSFCALSPELEYGRVEIEGTGYDFILGPAFSLPVTAEIVHQFMRELQTPPEVREQLTEFFYTIPRTSHQQFCRLLAFVHLCLNRKDISLRDLHMEDESKVTSRHTRSIKRDMEEERTDDLHNSFAFEQEMYQCIRNGSVAGLQELFTRHHPDLKPGKMAQSPVRHAKNIFIRVATNAGMLGAIPGGYGIEKTYQMIDSYVQECEQLTTIEEINNLQYMMVLDFCQKVSDTRLPEGISAEVYQCVSFIRSNTNRPLSVDDVAERVHRSSSYMMKRFKKELGIHISAFITQCRLEEAKRLLTYSNQSLAEISSYLCFSSQSYFQNVFKKEYGITPMQYRKQASKMTN